MGLFTTYKGLENEQNVKYKNIPFNEDSSFNSQPFIQTAPPGDGGGFKVASNVKGFIPKLTSGLTAGALNLTDGLSKTVPSLGAIARGAYRSAADVVRLTKFMTTPSGIEFILKQELLSRMAVQTEISGVSNGGLYNPLATLAQAGVSFSGIHLSTLTNINGEKLFDPSLGYGPVAYAFSKANPDKFSDNRLVSIYKKNITSETKNPNTLLSYPGGPGSVFGIGSTTIKFATQPDGVTPVRTMGLNFEFPEGTKKNTLLYQAQYDSSLIPAYEEGQNTLADYYKMGNPGRAVYSANGVRQKKSLYIPLDFVNARFIYSSNSEPQVEKENYNDLIRFKIGVLDVGTQKTNYTHFRAVIDSFSDSYSSDWSSQTYMGRGEKLYKYNSFDRSINMSFTVAAQSQAEMAGMYQKLNYLASTVTPQYTDRGYMTGNITKLTVGNYVKDQHGKIDSISFEIPEESPWLISNPENAFNTVINELPFIIKVQMRYTVIHDFRPELVTDIYRNINGENSPNFGSQRYITEKTYKPTGGNESIQFIDDLPEVSVNEKYTQGNVVPSLYYSRPKETPPPASPSIPRDTQGNVLFFNPNQTVTTNKYQPTSTTIPQRYNGNPDFITDDLYKYKPTTPSPVIDQSMMSINNSTPPPTSKTSTKTPPDPNKKSPKHQNILRRLFKPSPTTSAYSG